MVDVPDLLVTILELILLWICVSLPVYLIARTVSHHRTKFGELVGATLTGGIVYGIVVVVAQILLGAILGTVEAVYVFALFLAWVSWLMAFHFSLRLRWSSALELPLVPIIVFLGLNELLGVGLGIALPGLFQFPL